MSEVAQLKALLRSKFTSLIYSEGRWTEFHIDEVFKGVDSDIARYVPKVGDHVRDPKVGFFEVTRVDYSTGLSEMKPWYPAVKEGEGGEEDNITVGYVPGNGHYIYWCNINPDVTPHTLSIDPRLYWHGSTAKEIKVFKGTNISDSGEVISIYYSANGDVIGENIPLEISRITDSTNITTKNAVVGWSTKLLQDGEIVTAVVYDDAGSARSRTELLVQNTNFIRAAESSQNYITGIRLDSVFLSDTEKNILRYPINMPLESMVVEGIVMYSNGEQRRVPVDGIKMALYGTDNYVASILGQKIDLVLRYNLSSDEASLVSKEGFTTYLAEKYTAITEQVDGAYSVKLFVVPWWSETLSQWRLEYFLANIDRNDLYRVTDLIEPGTNTDPFNPTLYGVVQNLSVMIDLNKVDASLKQWRHPQRFAITLMGHGNQRQYPWQIEYTPGQTEWYGKNLEAVFTFTTVNSSTFNIKNGLQTQDQWLAKLYYNAEPLYMKNEEVEAPRPTHMTFMMGKDASMQHRFKVSIASWDQDITSPYFPEMGDSVFIEWTNEDGEQPLYLATTGLPVRRIITTP